MTTTVNTYAATITASTMPRGEGEGEGGEGEEGAVASSSG
jgi:hypothetical protein